MPTKIALSREEWAICLDGMRAYLNGLKKDDCPCYDTVREDKAWVEGWEYVEYAMTPLKESK